MQSITISLHWHYIALALFAQPGDWVALRLSSLFSLVFWVGSAFSNYLNQRNSNAHSFLNLHFYIFFQNTYTFYVEHFGNLIQRPVILLYFGWLANMVTRQNCLKKKALRLYIFLIDFESITKTNQLKLLILHIKKHYFDENWRVSSLVNYQQRTLFVTIQYG